MCGINGVYNFRGGSLQNGISLVKAMNASIEHRGPDDTGTWKSENEQVFLGHQRLSIIDLTASGHQPMIGPQGQAMVFNGEIYNHNELRTQFDYSGFDGTSDSELLLRHYDNKGTSCLDDFNGMFAIAIWDKQKEELFLARDRIGLKPLYYIESEGRFAFSSEIKALLTLPWVTAELDNEALYHFLTYNMLPAPLTMFKGIKKFDPGHSMIVNRNGIASYGPYWQVGQTKQEIRNEKDWEEAIAEQIKSAVKYRLESDVPIGAFLSGGVDSSAVVAHVAENADRKIKTYSIGFEGQPAYDELSEAREVANKYKTEHFEKIVTKEDIRELLPTIVNIFDEPLADTTAVPIYFLSQLAKENDTKVVLTGDGPDELFAGYSNWQRYIKLHKKFENYSKLPSIAKKGVSTLMGAYNSMTPTYDMLVRAENNEEFFWGGASGIKESTKKQFLHPDFMSGLGKVNSHDIIAGFKSDYGKEFDSSTDYVNWMCYLGLKFIIPNKYLHRADRLGMANSIEIRAPFMDHNFVELALSVPGNLKVKDGIAKNIFKKSLEPTLSKEILHRKKMGFCVPINEWGTDVMTDYVQTNIKSFSSERGIFKNEQIDLLLKGAAKQQKHMTNRLWNVYFIMNWIDKWL